MRSLGAQVRRRSISDLIAQTPIGLRATRTFPRAQSPTTNSISCAAPLVIDAVSRGAGSATINFRSDCANADRAARDKDFPKGAVADYKLDFVRGATRD